MTFFFSVPISVNVNFIHSLLLPEAWVSFFDFPLCFIYTPAHSTPPTDKSKNSRFPLENPCSPFSLPPPLRRQFWQRIKEGNLEKGVGGAEQEGGHRTEITRDKFRRGAVS